MAEDYYEVLGVPRTADGAEIQQAFRTLARRYHPDVNRDPAAEERFKQINEAYSVLSDPDTRSRYDRFGPDFRQVPEDYDERVAAGQGFGGGAGAYRGSPFGGSRGADRAGGRTWTETGFDASGVDFEDLFGGMFGGRAGGAGRGSPIPGADQEAELTLSVEEAYRGGRRKITLGGPGGERSYDVTIPAGVVDGQRIRLAGEGGRGRGPGSAGDLYLVVRIAPIPATGSLGATSMSICRSPPGRPRWGPRCRSPLRAGRSRCMCRPVPPPAAGCAARRGDAPPQGFPRAPLRRNPGDGAALAQPARA